ncbi:MAG: glycosyltransferase family 4 protein, partial [Acidimicrobiales bacterium]
VGWKGFHLGLLAFARLLEQVPTAEYWLIGDGEQRHHLERLVTTLAISDRVRFLGTCSREETFAAMAASDVLLHPSIRAHLGFVVLDAMAAARPVICLDRSGPPELVGDTGVVVRATTPSQAVDGLAEALVALHHDPVRRRQLGDAARQRVSERWSWHRIGRDLDEIYHQMVQQPDGTETAQP